MAPICSSAVAVNCCTVAFSIGCGKSFEISFQTELRIDFFLCAPKAFLCQIKTPCAHTSLLVSLSSPLRLTLLAYPQSPNHNPPPPLRGYPWFDCTHLATTETQLKGATREEKAPLVIRSSEKGEEEKEKEANGVTARRSSG